MLSGEQLVAKGVTKIDVILPEIGAKDVSPNRSWLEQKQIQSALEARKQLIEVERIEKSGSLSHAEWRDDLKLAEVTKQTGGYWQYLGCHIDKKLYLKPEEALFLMEVNSLLLRHNEVTVSIQKAYCLLLSDTISISQYKVYASLSRLGYKVYRHKEIEDEIKRETILRLRYNSGNFCNINETVHTQDDTNTDSQSTDEDIIFKSECTAGVKKDVVSIMREDQNNINTINVENDKIEDLKSDYIYSTSSTSREEDGSELYCNVSQKQKDDLEIMEISEDSEITEETKQRSNIKLEVASSEILLRKLLKRKIKPSNSQNIHNYFSDISDLYKKNVATVNVPKEEHLPKNIFVNNTSYVLNLERIKNKNVSATSNEPTYSASDEANESLRRIRNSSRNDSPQFFTSYPLFANMRTSHINQQYRPFNFWRPRSHLNYFQFNMFCQRPFIQNYFIPRFNFNYRMNNFLRRLPNQLSNPGYLNPSCLGIGFDRKRKREEKLYHLEHIKGLALRLKQLILLGNDNTSHIQSLQRLILTYNTKFRSRLRLTDDFEIVDDSNILETIELEDEDESKKKKSKCEDTFNNNLDNLRKLALRLKNIDEKDIPSSKPRRALLKAIKTFNESFIADVYLNSDYKIIDRRHITLASTSDSDSDCVVNENPEIKSKKLRNPFSILRTLSETIDIDQPSTSKDYTVEAQIPHQSIIEQNSDSDDVSPIAFDKNWLPNTDDFGRAEVVTKKYMNSRIMDTYNDELLYDFIHNSSKSYSNWLAAKIAFAKYILATTIDIKNNDCSIENPTESRLTPIIRPGDCTDMPSVLNKLRIIKTDKEVRTETSLKIDFDVYNRDVQNFRKSNRQKPHFRVICADESSNFPSGDDILGIHSKNKDDVAIVFAMVDVGSISYLQINPTDIPLYIPCNDLT